MNIAALIGIMIAIVVGTSMIPIITDAINTIQSSEEMSPTVSSLAGVLPIVFLAAVIIGAICFHHYNSEEEDEEEEDEEESLIDQKKKRGYLDSENDIVVQK